LGELIWLGNFIGAWWRHLLKFCLRRIKYMYYRKKRAAYQKIWFKFFCFIDFFQNWNYMYFLNFDYLKIVNSHEHVHILKSMRTRLLKFDNFWLN
jgi:hypothetical protein